MSRLSLRVPGRWSAALVFCCVVPVGVMAQAVPPELGVVVDSIPHLLDELVGYEDDQPYQVILRPDRVAFVNTDTRDHPPLGLGTGEDHPPAWLVDFASRSHVRAVCRESGYRGCSDSDATMILGLSDARLDPIGDARVQVSLRRPSGGAPHPLGHFTAFVELRLSNAEGRWVLADMRVLGIS